MNHFIYKAGPSVNCFVGKISSLLQWLWYSFIESSCFIPQMLVQKINGKRKRICFLGIQCLCLVHENKSEVRIGLEVIRKSC